MAKEREWRDLPEPGTGIKSEVKEFRAIFRGKAYDRLEDLLRDLEGAEEIGDVLDRALELLVASRGKEVEIRDPHTGEVIILHPWKRRR